MHDTLHAVLRHIVEVKERIGYARDAEEEDARGGEEEGAEVGSLGGLGDRGVEGQEGCFLDRLISIFLEVGRKEGGMSYDSSGDGAGAPFGLGRVVHRARCGRRFPPQGTEAFPLGH